MELDNTHSRPHLYRMNHYMNK